MNLVYAADVLRAKENSAKRYIERAEWIAKKREEEAKKAATAGTKAAIGMAPAAETGKTDLQRNKSGAGVVKETPLMQAVLRGEKKAIVSLTEQALSEGKDASVILETELIPAITEAGNRFEQKKYFLPQLIGAAEAMKAAVEVLEPLLQ